MFLYLNVKNQVRTDMKLAFNFLRQLSENNSRPWFEEHKDLYLQAKAEAEVLVGKCILSVGQFEPLGDIDAKKCMFRIFRDVRFSKNKDPYKKNFSALISSMGRKPMSGFSWYLHLEPDASFMASGNYEPDAKMLAAIRQEIDYNSEEFRAIIQKPEFQARFGAMQGHQLKTAPKGYPKDHPEIELLRYTQFYFSVQYSEKEILASDFPQKLAEDCKLIRPFLEFLQRAGD